MSIDLSNAVSEALTLANSIVAPLVEGLLPIILAFAFAVFLLGVFFGLPKLLGKAKIF